MIDVPEVEGRIEGRGEAALDVAGGVMALRDGEDTATWGLVASKVNWGGRLSLDDERGDGRRVWGSVARRSALGRRPGRG